MPGAAGLMALIPEIYDAGSGELQWSDVLDHVARWLSCPIVALGFRHTGAWFAVANSEQHVTAICPNPVEGLSLGSRRRLLAGQASQCEPITSEVGKCLSHGQKLDVLRTLLIDEPNCTAVFAVAQEARKPSFRSDFVGLSPHFARAIRIQLRRRAADLRCDYLSAALDQSGHGVIIVAPDARVLHANREARTLLGKRDLLRTERGRNGDHMLCHPQALVRLALNAEPHGRRLGESRVLLSRRSSASHEVYAVVVSFLSDEMNGLAERPVALILLIDAQRSEPNAEHLLPDFFGLTRAEASVADLSAKGIPPKQAARILCVAPSMVRTHLHRIFAKTGATRQAALAHLVRGLNITTSVTPTSAGGRAAVAALWR